MKRKVFVISAAGLLLAGIASMSYARGPGWGMNSCPRWGCQRSYGYQWNVPQMGPGQGRMCPQMAPGQMPRDPRSYGYQWNAPQMGPGGGRMSPQMGPGGGRMGPQMGPGQTPQDPQMWQQHMYNRQWELRNQIGEKLQERAWLLRQEPVDRERVTQLNEELAQLQEEMWGSGPGPQGSPGPGGWNCPTW